MDLQCSRLEFAECFELKEDTYTKISIKPNMLLFLAKYYTLKFSKAGV